jgi:hypothetical protein
MEIDTPWGKPQTLDLVADGIFHVSTASHGGILVSPERLASMPDYMRKPLYGGRFACYEEDCEWPMPVLVFEKDFRSFYEREGTKKAEDIFSIAKAILKNWQPNIYERYYGIQLAPGDSFKRDEEIFYSTHRDSWLVVAACGDWKEGVPTGMVGVCARIGGYSNKDTSKDWFFLVSADEYDKRIGGFAFIVDPLRHRESPSLF